MRHLQAVPDLPSDAGHTPEQRHVRASPTDFDPAAHEPSPQLQAMFDLLDDTFGGLSAEQHRKAVETMYFDGDGRPRARSLNRLELLP